MKEKEIEILEEIKMYVNTNKAHRIRKEFFQKDNFKFENIEEVCDALFIFPRKNSGESEEKEITFQESFYSRPITFVTTSGLIDIPGNIEILKSCHNSLLKSHKKACMSCKYNQEGIPKHILAVCMNRRVYETLLNILCETEFPKKVLFVGSVTVYAVEFMDENSRWNRDVKEFMEAVAQETGAVVKMFRLGDVTLIEVPKID